MKRYFFALLASALLFGSCEDTIDKPSEWPEWPTPSQPRIESPKLAGPAGETDVPAGSTVTFTATVADEFNELVDFKIAVEVGGATIFSKTVPLSGNSQQVSEQFDLPYAARMVNGMRPVVKLTAKSKIVNGVTELTLPDAANISVIIPPTPAKLYLVDNLGGVYEMTRRGETYGFASSASLASLGTSFKIASAVDGTAIDYEGLVWSVEDGKIVTGGSAADAGIPANLESGQAMRRVVFDMYTFEVLRCLDLDVSITLDQADRPGYDGKWVAAVPAGATLSFVGVSSLVDKVRTEYFAEVSGGTAVFLGPTANYTFYRDQTNGFLYIERDWNLKYPEAMWITGSGLGFPAAPYAGRLSWGWWDPKDFICMKKVATDRFEATVYAANGFVFKCFRQKDWASPADGRYEEQSYDYTLLPEGIMADGVNEWNDKVGDCVPGPDFTPGLYRLTIDVGTAKTITMTPL